MSQCLLSGFQWIHSQSQPANWMSMLKFKICSDLKIWRESFCSDQMFLILKFWRRALLRFWNVSDLKIVGSVSALFNVSDMQESAQFWESHCMAAFTIRLWWSNSLFLNISVCRPLHVIYFLKAMTNSFQTSISISEKCIFLKCIFT